MFTPVMLNRDFLTFRIITKNIRDKAIFFDLIPVMLYQNLRNFDSLIKGIIRPDQSNNQILKKKGGFFMNNRFLIGLLQDMIEMPPSLLEEQISKRIEKFDLEHKFMTEEHRLVHHFVVKELPRTGRPLPPHFITDSLGLPLERVQSILDELEKSMTFLVRNSKGEVSWAFPVTVDKTPHHITFNTGEKLYAA